MTAGNAIYGTNLVTSAGITAGSSITTAGNLYVSGGITAGGGIYAYSGMTAGNAIYTSSTVTASSFNATSDYRIKQNIQDINLHNQNINSLYPLYYYNTLSQKNDFGFLAHQVQEIFPFLVQGSKDGTETQSINYTGFIALMVKEIQDLKDRIKKLENKIDL